ncbi:Sjogren's syndrome/scleroderma autoantigen 1 family protein [Salinigranum salinum]|uniref:Sjogren's syndrome/scleroderma autoantigen 1 family protein n=1 Tax=Salinigranum salinum TaxID=1364937 RepID=UPI0012606792|nr:Sjogren's syndrome/scleroderma autoantigen 1 family protein [Salinigranum salinum]
MSDFDKEAEREKLREKYERDRQKRKETERMSQLLLQGATMTNHHCDTCGDPLFRYQGQEFCATCEGHAQEAEAQSQVQDEAETAPESGPPQRTESSRTSGADEGDGGATADGERTADDERAVTSAAADIDAGGLATGDEEPTPDARAESPRAAEETASRSEAPAAARDGSSNTGTPGGTSLTGGEVPTTTGSPVSPAPTPRDQGSGQQVEGDLDAARTSLVRTLTRHAERAEAAQDPRRATDHLTAVREAAEALAALDGRR